MKLDFVVQENVLKLNLQGDYLDYNDDIVRGRLLSTLESKKIQEIYINGKDLGDWDSTLVVILFEVAKIAKDKGINISQNNVPENLQQLVKLALAVDRKPEQKQNKQLSFLEALGTKTLELWSSIAISTLAERPDTTAVALEKFPATLSLASRNAKRNGVDARFRGLLADVLLTDDLPIEHAPFDAILSNPPYIPTKDIDALSPEVHAEPMAALDGGEDGLLFYRSILKNYTPLLKKDGFFLFEIGFDQADALKALAKEHHFAHVRVFRDFGNHDRVVYISHISPDERSILH